MATVAEITTAEQLFQEPGLGRCELLRGELVLMSPSGSLHAIIAATLAEILCDFVKQRKLGWVFGAEGGFHIRHDPDTVRAPDAAFVSTSGCRHQFPRVSFLARPIWPSRCSRPTIAPRRCSAKFRTGLKRVAAKFGWSILETRSIAVYAPKAEMRILHLADVLTGEDVLPGFEIEIRKIFP